MSTEAPTIGEIFLGTIVLIVGGSILFAPTIMAFFRGHSYKGVILGLNLASFVMGLIIPIFGFFPVYFGSFIWAVWPRNKSIIAPLIDVTGTSRRNVGDDVGASVAGYSRGLEEERNR